MQNQPRAEPNQAGGVKPRMIDREIQARSSTADQTAPPPSPAHQTARPDKPAAGPWPAGSAGSKDGRGALSNSQRSPHPARSDRRAPPTAHKSSPQAKAPSTKPRQRTPAADPPPRASYLPKSRNLQGKYYWSDRTEPHHTKPTFSAVSTKRSSLEPAAAGRCQACSLSSAPDARIGPSPMPAFLAEQ